jgi:hypothetical protein
LTSALVAAQPQNSGATRIRRARQIYGLLADLLISRSSGVGEVVQAGDAEHGAVDPAAF